MDRRKPELLCPAGDMEKLRMAVAYGADAVYLAGTSFGMRSFTANFAPDELPQAIKLAHDAGVKVHCTVNIMPRNDEAAALPAYLEQLDAAGVDALGDAEFLERNRAVIRAERPRLEERLRELGFWVCPSQANYILFRGEAGLADRLRERGAAIRDCANFEGLGPGWYRAAVRLREENDALLDAMRRAREDGRWR